MFTIETFIATQVKFVSFTIDTQFFFIDLNIIERNIFYGSGFVSFEFISIDLRKALTDQFIFEVTKTFRFLL